jgi:hypothetical protein
MVFGAAVNLSSLSGPLPPASTRPWKSVQGGNAAAQAKSRAWGCGASGNRLAESLDALVAYPIKNALSTANLPRAAHCGQRGEAAGIARDQTQSLNYF